MRVLAEHPHCLLKPEHLAGRRVGWGRKDEALVSLARELNVGVDSFVFVDDSSYECALVRESLPEVDVRQVPANAFALPALLRDAASLFCLGAATREDLSRTSAMAAEKLRTEAASAATDLASFLGSLGIVADIGEPDASVLPRLAQLTQRTSSTRPRAATRSSR
jgi:FkbH-like protein